MSFSHAIIDHSGISLTKSKSSNIDVTRVAIDLKFLITCLGAAWNNLNNLNIVETNMS